MKTRIQHSSAIVAILVMGASIAGFGHQQAGQSRAGADDDIDSAFGHWDGAAIARRLDNPRGLHLSGGRLFVAEAGSGGDGSCVPGIFAPEICLGPTGAVTMVSAPGRQRRILDGLPSLAGPDGTFAYGPSDVSLGEGEIFVSIGGPNEPAYREQITEPIGAKLGTIQLLAGRGSFTIADISAFVADYDPDGPPHETNTHSVLAGGHGVYAIDSGGNTLYRIDWQAA